MKFAGLYFIPTHNPTEATTLLSTLTTSLETHFHNPTPSTPWTLTYRLLRSTPAPSSSQTLPQGYHHILHISSLSQPLTFCYIHGLASPTQIKSENSTQDSSQKIQQPAETGKEGVKQMIITIPTSQSDPHIHTLITHLSPLWSHRQTLFIPPSPSYSSGEYTVRLGQLHLSRSPYINPGTATSATIPGVVVCIEAEADGTPKAEDSDSENDQNDIKEESGDGSSVTLGREEEEWYKEMECGVRDIWSKIWGNGEGMGLGGKGVEVREVMMDWKTQIDWGNRRDAQEDETLVKMWCEVLRLRA
ncbi:hypothetical protein GQ43DRAFT_393655 [Delitschia confertaspora ATCC 74209]|uniref:Mediator of RNA polymerase II transcription subunit 20 n=1 Tax=Delitschia confertaspora ATCC 74209 TaxID=1513339 RepID=A0A9P4JR53_9PLEO|nr:hypothetical protein GQ43DRAFT_393655 [Delitschia confertaspora ATCC 74209]